MKLLERNLRYKGHRVKVYEDVMETPDGEIDIPVSRSNVKPLKEALYAYVENSAF